MRCAITCFSHKECSYYAFVFPSLKKMHLCFHIMHTEVVYVDRYINVCILTLQQEGTGQCNLETSKYVLGFLAGESRAFYLMFWRVYGTLLCRHLFCWSTFKRWPDRGNVNEMVIWWWWETPLCSRCKLLRIATSFSLEKPYIRFCICDIASQFVLCFSKGLNQVSLN